MSTLLDRLSSLQNLVKRDASSYLDEFRLQARAFSAELDLVRLRPSGDSEAFRQLAMFMAHTAPFYPAESAALPGQLVALLSEHAAVLSSELRRTTAQALMLLRSRGVIKDAVALLKVFFALFSVRDKHLRVLLFGHIVADCRNLAAGGGSGSASKGGGGGGGAGSARDGTATRAVQAFMYTMLAHDSMAAAKTSLCVLVELYRRGAWTDARTVNVIASALTSRRVKLVVIALKFFLGVGAGAGGSGSDDEDADDINSDDDTGGARRAAAGSASAPKSKDVRAIEEGISHVKKTRKRVRATAKAVASLHRAHRKSLAVKGKGAQPVFPAITLLHDPQGLAEKLFSAVRSGSLAQERFEVRLMALNFTTRLVGQHRLLLLPIYAFLQRYLAAHQSNVTQVLAFLIQATHELVPPAEVQPVVMAISSAFVNESSKAEVMQVGMNSLREIFHRCPAVLAEPGVGDLVNDLVHHRGSRTSKGVVAASRSILNLVRQWYPALLKKRDRGRDVSMDASRASIRPQPYGAQRAATGVEGAELLALALARKEMRSGGGLTGDGSAAAAASFVKIADADEWGRGGGTKKKKARKGTAGALEEAAAATAAAAVRSSVDADDVLGLLVGEEGSDDEDEGGDGEGDSMGSGGEGRVDLSKAASGGGNGGEEEEDDDDDDEEDVDDDDEEDDDDGMEEEDDDDDEEEGEEEEEEGEEAPSGFAGRKRPRPVDEDEEDASEVPSSRARRTGGSVRFDASTSDRPSRSLSSKSAMRSALAARVSSALGGAVSSRAGGASSGGALGDIAGLRILTPKDFSRIKKLQAGLAARGITDPTTEDIMELLGGGRGGSRLSTATGGWGLRAHGARDDSEEAEAAGAEAWKNYQLKKRRRKSGRGLGGATEEGVEGVGGSDADKSDEDDEGGDAPHQLDMPGTSFAPPTVSFDPASIEAVETGKQRQQAERLLDVIKSKAGKKYEGHKAGGGTTNREKERKKNFGMLRRSSQVQGKLKRSLKDQGKAIRAKIVGDKKMDKRQKRKRRRV